MHKILKLLKTTKCSIKALPLASLLLISATSSASNVDSDSIVNNGDKRVELNFKQRHSGLVPYQNLYADGIKIKRDLSILKQIQEDRIIAEDEIPADELYQGVWANFGVKTAYTSIEKHIPDSFKVDLSNFTMPTINCSLGHVTSKFGPRRWRMHYGVDLKVLVGDTIYAAFDGKVRVKQYERRGYGKYLVLRHPNGLETVYGHLSDYLVNTEDVVKSGDPIALGGNTGRSTGSHLHFEVRFCGKAIDPSLIVDIKNKVCHKDEFLVTKTVLSDTRNIYTSTGGNVRYHRIRSGDTLGAIARRYGTSVKVLCGLNNMTSRSVLRIGRAIKVPPRG